MLLAAVGFRPPSACPAGSDCQGNKAEEPKLARYMPVPDGDGDDLDRLEEDWNNRLTYPTGIFNPGWVRAAAAQDAAIARNVPAGVQTLDFANSKSPLTLDPTNFTALGPQPMRMTGCSGCFNYQHDPGPRERHRD